MEDEDSDEGDSGSAMQRSIRWLCQEGQIRWARQRFERLASQSDKKTALKLKQEVFSSVDGNCALTEILAGGTDDSNAHVFALTLLDYATNFPVESRKMLLKKNSSHGRTPLHWAAWANANLDVLKKLVRLCPEALLLEDKKKQGNRTPPEIYRYYFSQSKEKMDYLESATKSWIRDRLRLAIYEATFYHFIKMQLLPFDQKDRRVANVKPRPWFLVSVLGFLLQREMKSLASHILSYVGIGARVHITSKRRKGRKRTRPV